MGSGNSKKKSVLLATHTDHEGPINCMALSEDGSILVTGSEDNTARMWSTKTRDMDCLGVFRGHSAYVTCVDVVDTYILTGSGDHTVRKWDMTDCSCLHVYYGHTDKISRLLCTGNYIFSSSADKTVKAWSFFPNSGLDDDEDDCIRTFTGHMKGVTPMIFIPGDNPENPEDDLTIGPNDILLTGSYDKTARSWLASTGKNLKTFKGHKDAIMCMVTDPAGQILYTGSHDCSIRSWNIITGRPIKEMEGQSAVMSLTVANRLLYSGSKDGTAHCWVREMGDCTRTYKGHSEPVVSLKFHEGILFTGSSDTTAAAYDSKSGTRLKQYKDHSGAINCLTVVEGRLVTGSSDNTLRVWNITELFKNDDSEEEDEDEDDEDDDDVEKGKQNTHFQKLDNYTKEGPDITSSPENKKNNYDLDCIEQQLM